MDAKLHRPNIDGLRFLMCIGIAICHLGPYFFGDDEQLIHKFDYFTDIFFIMSGYLLARSNTGVVWTANNYLIFLKKRIVRLYPLYLASLSFFIIVALLTAANYIQPNNPARYDLSLIPYHLLLMQSWGFIDSLTFNYVAWALSALWLMYLLFPFFITLVGLHPHRFLLYTVSLIFVLNALSYLCFQVPLPLVQQYEFGFLRAIPCFMFGVWLPNVDKINFSAKLANIAFWGISIILLFAPVYFDGIERYGFIFPIIFFFILVDNAQVKTILAWKGFKQLAMYSYGVFLLHTIIATVFLAFLMPKLIDENIFFADGGWVYSCIALLLSLLLSLLVAIMGFNFIEKPATSLLDKHR